ncbi:citrulline utilization hydrolase CtlX [Alteromonas sp. a30]|uniref:citrulline utilization hydrolase CtlX n=1 Tax=Alteromonas sp. a30 TaxID=2730917 RepID=UPI00228280B5|nr:arginine deiminase-related protein [Alteromonas sp. a30]MCY7294055.1 amidinotransferase [Alteromonas sp. a30]
MSQSNNALCANTLLMVPPSCFKFNTETGADNEFQHHLNMTDAELQKRATQEFDNMVARLRKFGANVLVFDDPQDNTPDAVFPNNWFSTDGNGNVYIYPMVCENRQREVKPEALVKFLEEHQYQVKNIIDVRSLAVDKAKLEGTGAMVFDHRNNSIYAAISQRCNQVLLEQCAQRLQVNEVLAFDTLLASGQPVYHTNVMLSVGDDYAIVCAESIVSEHRQQVLESLKDKRIIEISLEQLTAFCGNVLQICNADGKKALVMSQTAFDAFTHEQKETLAKSGDLLAIDVPTIEAVGGGSVRCMLAEIFLP